MPRNDYTPAEVLPPGATLAETLEAIGTTQAELARISHSPSSALRAPSPRTRGEGPPPVAPRPACGERVARSAG